MQSPHTPPNTPGSANKLTVDEVPLRPPCARFTVCSTPAVSSPKMGAAGASTTTTASRTCAASLPTADIGCSPPSHCARTSHVALRCAGRPFGRGCDRRADGYGDGAGLDSLRYGLRKIPGENAAQGVATPTARAASNPGTPRCSLLMDELADVGCRASELGLARNPVRCDATCQDQVLLLCR